jgi:glycosyltransferase involved in cell wall biosynthesis
MGTRGAPALYGGFETAVEEIGSRLAERGYQVTVYCRNPGQSITEYKGMKLVNLPAIKHRMAETLSHTALSSVHAIIKDQPDVCLLLNAGNAPFLLPLKLAKIPTAIHLDGLESTREKWRGLGAKYYRWAEKSAVTNSQVLISDAQAIADHVKVQYGKDSEVIAYGAQVINPEGDRLAEVNLKAGEYHLIVARLEPENHVLDAVYGYTQSADSRPLVVVGSAPYSDWYIQKVQSSADHRTRFMGAIYDQELLDQLYAHAATYTHGHSVGGTNPSLLRAMGAAAPVLAFDCEFNREVTDNKALYWTNAADFTELMNNLNNTNLSKMGEELQERVATTYHWDAVTDQYEELIQRMVTTK